MFELSEVMAKAIKTMAKMSDQCSANPQSERTVHFSQAFATTAHGLKDLLEAQILYIDLEAKKADFEQKKLEAAKTRLATEAAQKKAS